MMTDLRRTSTLAIIATFMLVTVAHVAAYASSFEPPGAGVLLGWPYAMAVEASIVVSAYFTRWKTTRLWAWVGYFAFVVASGIMNVGYIQPHDFPAWVYALFPTAAISLLGFLYRQVDQLVQTTERKRERRIEPAQSQHQPAQQPAVQPQAEPEPAHASFTCQDCEREFASVQALNAHKRFCEQKVANLNGKD